MSDFPAEVVSGFDYGTSVEQYAVSDQANENFIPGDFVVYDAGNDWAERAGADPSAILGISEVYSDEAAALTPDLKAPIRTLTEKALLRLSCGTTLVPATHLNGEYGITRNANGHWQLDIAKTTTDARCVVVRIDEDTNSAYVRMLAEYLVNDGIDS